MNWGLLGIEPTKDKKAITAAYRSQLAHTNPEDKPEEFKALRAAYEEALQLADQTEQKPILDQSPVGLWTQKVRALYNDFPRRIDPACWEQLLEDDVCAALDTRPLAEEALLRFLMEDFYIPQAVWQTLDRAFFWSERRDELIETYPRDFVDFAVMNGIRYPGGLSYDLFTPGVNANDCDEYRRLYYQADRVPPAEMPPILAQMEALSESHPYGELLSYFLMLQNGETEKALAGYQKLAQEYPDDSKLQLEWAGRCMNLQNWQEAEQYIRRALKLRPENTYAKQMLATSLFHQKQYDTAKEMMYQVLDAAGGDQKRIGELHRILQSWNDEIILELEQQIAAEPQNMKLKIDLGWCYLQNERGKDALLLCQSIDPDYQDQYDYHNLYGKVAYSLNEFETALTHLQKTEEILRAMQPDGTEKTATRIDSLPEKLQMQGSCLLSLGDSAKAMEKYEQAVQISPDDPEVLTHMGRMLCYRKELGRAADVFKHLTDVMPDSYHGFYLLSQTMFDLGQDRDAFDAINRALELEGGDLGVYLLKMRILLRNGAWDAVREVLEFLHQNGITDEINTLWCEAQLAEDGDNDKEKALQMYRDLAARVENGEMIEEPSDLYYRLLCLEGEKLDATKAEDRQKMMALAEKSLSYNENNYPCLDYKAWLLKRDDQREAALELYHRLENVSRRSMNVEQELAELYYKDLSRDADKSLHYYKLLLEENEHPNFLFYAGTCCRYLGLYEEGERYFLRLQELAPESIDGYNGLSYLYDVMKRYEDALTQVNQVIELIASRENDDSSYYYHKARILRRLNRPMEAMAVIDEMSQKYGNDDIYQDKFEICCQFGLWEQAEALLKEWRKSGLKKNAQKAAATELKLLMGKTEKAKIDLLLGSGKLNAFDSDRLNLMLGKLEGNEAAQVKVLNKRLSANKSELSHELMNMAQVMWYNGRYDKAREYASQALEQLNELIPKNKKYEALYRGRRCLVLAILGRFEEAEAELAEIYQLPLCESCNYCTCKDADVFKANIEEIRGDYARALELYREGADRWHDDVDFISGENRMKRKGL